MNKFIQLGAVAGLAAFAVAGCGGGGSSNNDSNNRTYTQRERLARPVVNEVFATVANDQHLINDSIAPAQDATELAPDIQGFMTNTAGRSAETTRVVTSVLVPDVMVADLSVRGEAAYLGNETGGATSGTKSTFGGRKLQDDVVDISLGIVFGNTIAALKLAPPDNAQIDGVRTPGSNLTTDNVGPSKTYLSTFPYLPNPK